jgi:hypothetical protein
MTLANEPDSAARDAIVQRDLDNVLHPIVQHKQLERQQLVVANLRPHCRIVSCVTEMPRAASIYSTMRRLNGNRKYSQTA